MSARITETMVEALGRLVRLTKFELAGNAVREPWKSALDKADAALAAALSTEPGEAEGWRDMSSAPTDRFILLYCNEDQSRWLAKWQGGVWYGVDDLGLTREGHSAGDPNFVTGWFVDGWRDLPAAPLPEDTHHGR